MLVRPSSLPDSAARPPYGARRERSPAAALVAAGGLGGTALWLSSPAVGIWWLAPIALLPVAVLALRDGRAASSRLAVPLAYAVCLELQLVPALPLGLARGHWGDPVVPVEVGHSPALFVAAVAVPLAAAILYAVRFGRPWPGRRRSAAATAAAAILYPACCWTTLDLLRSKFDPGGLWGPLFLSQHESPLVGLAALAGPWTVTFAIVATAYAAALPVARGRAGLPAAALGLAAVAALLAASLAAGGSSSGRSVRVAAIQPGYDTSREDLPVLRYFRPETHHRAAVDLIGDLSWITHTAARRGARLVVWPEAVVWVDPRQPGGARAALQRLARESGVALVVPYFLPRRAEGAAIVVDGDGALSRPQPKQRPMWFLGEKGGNRVPPRPAPVAGLAVGTLLGVDNQDPGVARRLRAGAADVLTSSTHDWPQLAVQQRALSQMHAAALGVPLVRADWQYGSAIYAAGGRLLADAGLADRRMVIVADVVPGDGMTVYARVGDAVAWAIAAATLALAAAAGIRSRRQRGTGWGWSSSPQSTSAR